MKEDTADGIQDMVVDGTPLFWGSVDVGDALYTPVGAVVVDSTGHEDCIGVRTPIIAQWDELALQQQGREPGGGAHVAVYHEDA